MKRESAPGRRVFFVIGTLDVGGTERHLAELGCALVRRGWEVTVYSLAGDGALSGRLRDAGVIVSGPSRRRYATSRSWIRRVVGRCASVTALLADFALRRPGIVHFFLPASYLVGAPLALLTGRPIRIMSRRSTNDYQKAHPVLRRLERLLHGAMTAVLGNSRAVVRQLRDEENVDPRRLGLIYNGIDPARFPEHADMAAVRESLGIGAGALVMAIVANLIPYKGHGDLFRALIQVKDRLPRGWVLLVIGRDDGIGAELAEVARKGGIAGNVRFLGNRDDVAALYAAADIGLLVSHQEGFANAVLEGMAAGLPMIVTDVGGNAEAVEDRHCGIVVAPGVPDRLAEAIVELATSEGLRREYGEAGRKRALSRFGLTACVDDYEALYDGLQQALPLAQIGALQAGLSCAANRD